MIGLTAPRDLFTRWFPFLCSMEEAWLMAAGGGWRRGEGEDNITAAEFVRRWHDESMERMTGRNI